MALFSASIATLMLFVALASFQHKFFVWSTLEPKAQLFIIFVSVFLALLTASGWLYMSLRKRVFGIIHAVLMLSVTGFSFYFGLPPLSKSSSYHAEWLTGLLCLALAAVGMVALICAVGTVWHLSGQKNE
jgi:hypothetical protein